MHIELFINNSVYTYNKQFDIFDKYEQKHLNHHLMLLKMLYLIYVLRDLIENDLDLFHLDYLMFHQHLFFLLFKYKIFKNKINK